MWDVMNCKDTVDLSLVGVERHHLWPDELRFSARGDFLLSRDIPPLTSRLRYFARDTCKTRIWDVATGKARAQHFTPPARGRVSTIFSPAGRHVCFVDSSWEESRIWIWDLAEDCEIATYANFSAAIFSVDGSVLALQSSRGLEVVLLADMRTLHTIDLDGVRGENPLFLLGSTDIVACITYGTKTSPDTMHLCSLQTGSILAQFECSVDCVPVVLPNGQVFACLSGSRQSMWRLRDISSGALRTEFANASFGGRPQHGPVFSSDGQFR